MADLYGSVRCPTWPGIAVKPWTPGTPPHGRRRSSQGLTLHSAEKLGNQFITYAAVPAQAPLLSVPCYTNSVHLKHIRSECSCHCGYEVGAFDSSLAAQNECSYYLPVFLGFSAIPVTRWNDRVSQLLPKTRRPGFMEQSFTHDVGRRDVGQRICSTSTSHGDIETNEISSLGANDHSDRYSISTMLTYLTS